jgi:hypothetical protein
VITVKMPKVTWYEVTCRRESCGAVLRAHLSEACSVSSAIDEFPEYWVLQCIYCDEHTKFVPEECAVKEDEP